MGKRQLKRKSNYWINREATCSSCASLDPLYSWSLRRTLLASCVPRNTMLMENRPKHGFIQKPSFVRTPGANEKLIRIHNCTLQARQRSQDYRLTRIQHRHHNKTSSAKKIGSFRAILPLISKRTKKKEFTLCQLLLIQQIYMMDGNEFCGYQFHISKGSIQSNQLS